MLTFQCLIQQRSYILPDYIIFCIRFIIFAIFHSLLATESVKTLVARINGREPRFYRLIYNLISLLMFGWVMAAWRNSAVVYYAPGGWSLALYLGQLLVLIIIYSCLRQTGLDNFLGLQYFPEKDSSNHLITKGFYSFVRHPLYFFSILFLLLNPVMTLQWLLLTVFTVIYFVVGALIEERRLLKLYGFQYRSYQQEVPFIVPSFKKFRRPTNV